MSLEFAREMLMREDQRLYRMASASVGHVEAQGLAQLTKTELFIDYYNSPAVVIVGQRQGAIASSPKERISSNNQS